MIRASQLSVLSDLDGADLELVASRWTNIPLDRRLTLVRLINEITEDNVELNFEGVLRRFIDDPDEAVRTDAIHGLWECTDPKLIAPLLSLLRTDESERVRGAAAMALGHFVLRAELGQIRERYRSVLENGLREAFEDYDESPVVRRRAIEALGAIDNDAVADLIELAHEDEEADVRVGAIYAMGRSANPRWLPFLVEESESAVAEHRYEAANAFGELEDPEAIPTLVGLVRDPDPEVRYAAIAALGKIGGREAERALKRLLDHSDDDIREAAEEALEDIDFKDSPLG